MNLTAVANKTKENIMTKLEEYENEVKKIKEATGLSDVNEII